MAYHFDSKGGTVGNERPRGKNRAAVASGIDDTAEMAAGELESILQSAASIEVSQTQDAETEDTIDGIALDDTAVVSGDQVSSLVESAASIDVDSSREP